MHWPMDDLDETLEGWSEMAKLKDEGKLRWIGVSNYSREELLQAAMIAPVTSLQPPYSLIRREIEADVLPTCRELGAGVIVYSPMGSGMLTGKFSREYVQQLPADDWRRKNPAFREPALSANLAVADRVAQVARRLGRAPGEVAIAWTLRHPAVSAAIVGARNPAQVEGSSTPRTYASATRTPRFSKPLKKVWKQSSESYTTYHPNFPGRWKIQPPGTTWQCRVNA
jgi:aryl-alcohol dehydrogenase-like predicted oxidoreductase